jgi:hypothetical protein
MKRRSSEEGQSLVERYRESGLTQERYAKKARINVAVLRYWLKRVREVESGDQGPVRFVELTAADEDASCTVRIETPDGILVKLERLPGSEYLVDLVLGLSRR